MAKSKVKAKPQKRIPLPEHFASLEEAGPFWDTHDRADYEEYVSEAANVWLRLSGEPTWSPWTAIFIAWFEPSLIKKESRRKPW